jgi:dTDP-4-amino-4,6-dideoxygalactose transaminase
VVTSDEAIAERARTLRFHGSRDKETFTEVGYNSRLDEMQAAVLRALLPHLDGWSAARGEAAAAYAAAGLANHVDLPRPPQGAEAAWHLYVVTHPDPDALVASLSERGIAARGYYRTPVHRQPAMRAYADDGLELTATDELARTNLAVPIGPTVGSTEAEQVVAALEQAARVAQ